MIGQKLYDTSKALHNWYRRNHNYVDATSKARIQFWTLIRQLNDATSEAIAAFEDRRSI